MSASHSNLTTTTTQAPKLLDRLRARLQQRGFGLDVQNQFVEWSRQFILFHRMRHPNDMGAEEVAQFLHHLARQRLPMRWRREAWEALGFLYREELGRVVTLPDMQREFPARAEPAVAAPHREAATSALAAAPTKPRLLDKVRALMRVRHYSARTEDCYVMWIKRFIFFHNTRHPAEMGGVNQ